MSDFKKEDYKFMIFDALLQIQEVEHLVLAIPIPSKDFEFLRYKKYPYSNYMDTDNKNRIMENRIIPYLNDCIYLEK